MAELTPMMKQYIDIKEQYKDCILFYRLGDFYEMFYDDALTASKELEITLTGKNCGQEERAPMCGVPYHAVEGYLSRLVSKGYRVAICEQTEDPKAAKGIVKREVIRIVTPGTNLNTQTLDETKNNYIMCIVYENDVNGIAIADVTTGDFYVTENSGIRRLVDEINNYAPTEIICNSAFLISGIDIDDLRERRNISVGALDDWYFNEESCANVISTHFGESSSDSVGLEKYRAGRMAAGVLLEYLVETQKTTLANLTHIQSYEAQKYMALDSATRRNLELCETMREKQKRGSLLNVLDRTKTAMGARKLRNFVEQPLIDRAEIEERQEAVAQLKDNVITREEIREYLNSIYDLERLMGKVSYKTANPRDLLAFSNSLSMLPHIHFLMKEFDSALLKRIMKDLDPLEDLHDLIERAIEDDPPISSKDGGIIKDGFSEEVDSLRNVKTEGKKWLAEMEAKERSATGIKNLRIKFNRVFGYYLEVTNSYLPQVPENWIRKQTLTNAERYTTPELKELENRILNAEDRLFALEYELFGEVRDRLYADVDRILKTAKAIAGIDAFASLAYVAERNNYCRPALNCDGIIDIKGGRHPVVEQMLKNDMFIENDTYLDNDDNRVSIITGPNMAGKSTYMRQTALIVFMAQIGSFVPAETANIGIVDRIFTRVGASDDLASGQSTFMVEMTEVSNILKNATKNSLLILDEIGRGTSTFDGLSIAWAVVEHIANPKLLGAKTLFATHYHELTELEGKLSSVNNYCIAVKEQGESIVFLRKIIRGGADKSYGIQVARLAGVPEDILRRATEIVEMLSDNDIGQRAKVSLIEIHEQAEQLAQTELKKTAPKKKRSELEENQFSLFDTVGCETILDEIRNMDLSNLTPIDALNKLYQIQKRVKDVV